jgi:hypothetical protein
MLIDRDEPEDVFARVPELASRPTMGVAHRVLCRSRGQLLGDQSARQVPGRRVSRVVLDVCMQSWCIRLPFSSRKVSHRRRTFHAD